MTEAECRALFTLAGFEVLHVKALIDGYSYDPSDHRYFETLPRQVWWFVKTQYGWIEIGWRKRVIQIDWSETGISAEVTTDDVTKHNALVHAWSVEKALEYLRALRKTQT